MFSSQPLFDPLFSFFVVFDMSVRSMMQYTKVIKVECDYTVSAYDVVFVHLFCIRNNES